jgi:hypothetical protein
MSVSYADRIDELGGSALIGTVGDNFDNAMAKSVMDIFKTELHRNPAILADNDGRRQGLDDFEISQRLGISIRRSLFTTTLSTRGEDLRHRYSRLSIIRTSPKQKEIK